MIHRQDISRESFNEKVDKSGIDSRDLFNLSISALLQKESEVIRMDDLITYAQYRFKLEEYPKVIYYCYFGLLELHRAQLNNHHKNNDRKIFLKIIEDSIDQLIWSWSDYENLAQNSLILKQDKISTEKNTHPINEIFKSVQIDTITLMSYSARKMSGMERIDKSTEKAILNNFESLYKNGDYEWAINEIYFLFADAFLKKDIIYRNDILKILKDFCKNWRLNI